MNPLYGLAVMLGLWISICGAIWYYGTKWIDREKWTMLPMLDHLSYWFCPNCFRLLTVLDDDSIELVVRMAYPLIILKSLLIINWSQEVKGQGNKITFKVYTGSTIVVRIITLYIIVSIIEKRWTVEVITNINLFFTWVNCINW